MAKTDLLKEAIADAKAVKETAIANAKIALEEAFGNRLQSMLGQQLSEQLDEEDELAAAELDMAAGEEEEVPAELGDMEDDMAGMDMPDSIGVGIDIDSDGTYDYEGDIEQAPEDEMEPEMDDMDMEPEMEGMFESEEEVSKEEVSEDEDAEELEEGVTLKAAPAPVKSEEGSVNKKSAVAANAGAKGAEAKPVMSSGDESGRAAPTAKDLIGKVGNTPAQSTQKPSAAPKAKVKGEESGTNAKSTI